MTWTGGRVGDCFCEDTVLSDQFVGRTQIRVAEYVTLEKSASPLMRIVESLSEDRCSLTHPASTEHGSLRGFARVRFFSSSLHFVMCSV